MSWKSYGVVLGGSTLLSLCCILTIQLYDVIESIHFCWTMEMFYHVRLGRVTEVNMSTNMRKRQWVIARRAIMKRRRRRDAESLWRELMRWGMLTWSFLVWYMFLATFFCLFEQLEFLFLYSHQSVSVPALWRHWLTGSCTERLLFLRNSPKLTGAQRQEGWEEDARLGLFDLLCIQSR